ncbi:MAG: hypothetical protein ACK4PR_13800, partial [Gammaproteobacteria bacterium]
MKKFATILGLACFSTTIYASSAISCQPLPAAAKNFNANDYNNCITSVYQCPKTGPYYDNTCVTKAAAQNPTCKSASAIAKAVNASITQLSFSPMDAYNIVTVTYPADGQVQNYILSPKGCLVDTIVDPRKLSKDLHSEYAEKELVIVNTELPTAKKQDNGNETFSVLLRVTQECLACTVL